MRAGRLQVGAGIGLSDPLVSDILAGSLDFLWIDLEHSPVSPEALSGHLLAARARGKPGIVRVPMPGTAFLKPVLDLGADGIIELIGHQSHGTRECASCPQGTRECIKRVRKLLLEFLHPSPFSIADVEERN